MTTEELNRIDQCRHLLPDPAPCSAPSVFWKAVAQVIADEGKPLEVWRVAKATGKTEEQIISALIRESFEIIGAASLSISHLEQCLESGAEIKKQDGKWHLFAADGNGIKCRETLPELLLDLPPMNAD